MKSELKGDKVVSDDFIRAFWRRVDLYKNDYGKELPEQMPVQFSAAFATASIILRDPLAPERQSAEGRDTVRKIRDLLKQSTVKVNKAASSVKAGRTEQALTAIEQQRDINRKYGKLVTVLAEIVKE